jgi:hypothetical protein
MRKRMKNFIKFSILILMMVYFSMADFVRIPPSTTSQWSASDGDGIVLKTYNNGVLYVTFSNKSVLYLTENYTERGWVYTDISHSCFISLTSQCEGTIYFPAKDRLFNLQNVQCQ